MKKHLLLVLILILATLLRFWNLENNPPGLTWDEAALGYNAYSLLQTGRDEYGNFLPLNLKSFGDYKPALYAYLDVPFIAIFGLNGLAVRLPAALFGVLGVFGVYLLVRELFKNEQSSRLRAKLLALLSAFFLAISPWHIQFSRPAFEAGVALSLNLAGVLFFIKGVKTNKFFILSALFFGTSLLTYQGSKLFVPLMIFSLSLLYFKRLTSNKYTKISLLIFTAFFISFTALTINQNQRLSTLNFFAYQRSALQIQVIEREDNLNGLAFQVLHGEWWAYVRGLFERYLIYFSPKMLFVDGDYSQRHRVPDLGVLYYLSLITIPLGIIYFLKAKGAEVKLLFIWLLIAPIPAVLSRDLISTLRALNMVIPLVILEAAGLLWLVQNRKRFKFIGIGLLICVLLINLSIYLDRYFIHVPREYSKYWLYGYSQMVGAVAQNKDKYNKVIISDSWGQPYIYYLFYTKYSPYLYQKQALLDQPTVDVGTVRRIDNIEFRHIYWPEDRGEKNYLFVGPIEELPDQDIKPFKEFQILEDINFLNGENAFRIVEVQ